MSWDLNRAIVIGRLTRDVELKYTPDGTSVGKFSIAVGGKPKADGTETVSFFNVTVWGKIAENCARLIAKGKQVAIDGRLEQHSWNAEDGTKRNAVEIIAERVEFLGGNQKPGEAAPEQEQTTEQEPGPDDPNF